MSVFIIAVDGPAASGKGTLSRALAEKYNFAYLDTGKLYRLVGLHTLKSQKNPDNEIEAGNVAKDLAGNFTSSLLENQGLKSDEAGNAASKVAKHDTVRQALIDLQRKFPETIEKKGAIIDGRDIGTVIFPGAPLKFFVTADITVRAQRRFDEIKLQQPEIDFEKILSDMRERDTRDSNRKTAPTKIAEDAVIIDTTEMTIEASVDFASRYVEETMKKIRQKA